MDKIAEVSNHGMTVTVTQPEPTPPPKTVTITMSEQQAEGLAQCLFYNENGRRGGIVPNHGGALYDMVSEALRQARGG